MKFFSWNNFWVNRRKIKDRDKIIVTVCQFFGVPLLAFYGMSRADQDKLIEQYKQSNKGQP